MRHASFTSETRPGRDRRFAPAGFRGFISCIAAAFVFLPLGVGCESGQRDRDIEYMSIDEARGLMERRESGNPRAVLLIDPRSASAYNAEHIPTARNILLTEVPEDLGRDRELSAFDTLVVYGRDPGSAIAKAMTKRLMQLKYDDVYLFAAGLEGWRAAGFPTEGDAAGEPETAELEPQNDPSASR